MGFEGVMLAALLAANIILEWKLLSISPWFREFVIRRQYLQIALSIIISLVAGHVFGATGLMCLAVGLVSTLIMSIFWSIFSKVEKMTMPKPMPAVRRFAKRVAMSYPLCTPAMA